MSPFQSYIMWKTPSKLNIRFQRYIALFSNVQNNKIQRQINEYYWPILKSIQASSDSFCFDHITCFFFSVRIDNVNYHLVLYLLFDIAFTLKYRNQTQPSVTATVPSS